MDMEMDLNDHGGDSDDGGDGEGVWSPDIEQCFREALLIFPPCGRRKHILNEEGGGKMYGRNELIARHIKMRTGKTRTRKQVSSHIQVLNRRKAKAEGGSTSSTGMPSPTMPMGQNSDSASLSDNGQSQQGSRFFDQWLDRPIVTQKIRLVEFSAFVEHPSNQNFSLNNYQHQITNLSTAANLNTDSSVISEAFAKSEQQQQQQQLLLAKQEDMSQIQSGMQRIGVSSQQQQQGVSPSLAAIPHLPLTPTITPTNPLGSNLQLTAQFNQANYMTTSINTDNNNTSNNNINNNNLNLNGNGSQQGGDYNNQRFTNNEPHLTVAPTSLGQQHSQNQRPNLYYPGHLAPTQTPLGVTRHSYIKIDYTQQAQLMQANNRVAETININQIFDKFPELGGSEGLFQRGQPDSFFLVKFWANIHSELEYDAADQNSFFGYSCEFETCDPYKNLTCITKVCSYGNPLVDKIVKMEPVLNETNGRYSFKISRSQMCDFMIEFIRKLSRVPSLSLMNSVLENFSVLQVITSESSTEILLCLAYVFEILPPTTRSLDNPPVLQYNVYKLTKD